MASGPYERFYPGEARGLIDPTWPGVTERGVQETWVRNLASFNERQREKKRERVREVYGTVPPSKKEGVCWILSHIRPNGLRVCLTGRMLILVYAQNTW